MREELYRDIKSQLELLCTNATGEIFTAPEDMDSDLYPGAIRHIDLWNRNVEFIEQEAAWERPAVFIEFLPIQWNAIAIGQEYRAQVTVNLHIVTDWNDRHNIEQFRLLDAIHRLLAGMSGKSYAEFDLVSSTTNHNHEDIVENIETYSCIGIRSYE